jgi:hypothetical protein
MDSILEEAKNVVLARVRQEVLSEQPILIKARVLSIQEAIGNPEEYDFPLLKGKEKIIEADYCGHLGHAYTDMYGGFRGSLESLFKMAPVNNYRRALQVAAMNALAGYWKLVDHTVHCKDEQPKKCALRCREFIEKTLPQVKNIAFIGYQPAILDILCGRYRLKILDLDKDNIGQNKFGSVVLDGQKDISGVLAWADLVLATGSTITNGTIDDILQQAGRDKTIFYGVTISGAAALLGLQRICFPGSS